VIVVSNTSPVLNLACIGEQAILEKLFGTVQVPPAVQTEVERLRRDQPKFARVELPPFTPITAVRNRALVAALSLELDNGEAEAIALAVELRADLLLVDEHRGRRVARRMGLKPLGLLGALTLAKRQGLISEIQPVLRRLESEAGFWVGTSLRRQVLAEAGEAEGS
jgi:hypothetical protein